LAIQQFGNAFGLSLLLQGAQFGNGQFRNPFGAIWQFSSSAIQQFSSSAVQQFSSSAIQQLSNLAI